MSTGAILLTAAGDRARQTTCSPSVAIHCAELRKTFGQGENEVRALGGIDLDIYTGELLMLVGPSGCGKTTLISVITGILDRSGGSAQPSARIMRR